MKQAFYFYTVLPRLSRLVKSQKINFMTVIQITTIYQVEGIPQREYTQDM